jgi:D-3-phosphoglycerate dehydrogenase / 2-oxoglutarate reductase
MVNTRILRGPLTRAIVLENPDSVLDEGLKAAGFEVVRVEETPDRAELFELLERHRPQILFKRSRLEIDAEILDHAPDLFAVMLCCIGDDSVDKQAAADRGILVQNDPRSNGRSVAELVIGQLLVGARRIPEAWTEMRSGRWEKSNIGRFEVKGRTIGIFGLGSIGKMVARMAEALGMKVLFYDTDEVAIGVGEAMDWQCMDSPAELFAHSDVVTLHLSAEDFRGRLNRGLVTRKMLLDLGKMRDSDSPRLFINLSRGFLVDPADLRAALDADAIRQAFIDVFPDEPQAGQKRWSNPFADEPRVQCTPHIGAATREAQPRIGQKMVRTASLLSISATVEDCIYAPRRRIDVASSAEAPYVLSVLHADARGTKKAVDDAIFGAGVDNLQSAHRDFPRYGLAYDLSVLSRALTDDEVAGMIESARRITGREDAIRAVRQVTLRGH